MWSFPGSVWQSRTLYLVLGISVHWSSTRGWVMFSFWEYAMLQSRYLLIKRRGVPVAIPRSSSSISQQCRTTSACDQGDLSVISVSFITVWASPSSASPWASHSSSTSRPLLFSDEVAGSPDRSGPSISFKVPADDRISIAALGDKLCSGDDDSTVLPP